MFLIWIQWLLSLYLTANHLWVPFACCFVALETKRKSGWGICGSSWFVLLWFCMMICHFHWYWPIRRPDGSVGMALVLPALTDCRWWFESLLVHSGVSSATRRKATGADPKKITGTGQLRCVPPFWPLMSLSGPCHRALTAKLEKKKFQCEKVMLKLSVWKTASPQIS